MKVTITIAASFNPKTNAQRIATLERLLKENKDDNRNSARRDELQRRRMAQKRFAQSDKANPRNHDKRTTNRMKKGR